MRSSVWLPYLSLPALLVVGCGHAPAARPVAAPVVTAQEACGSAEASVAELEALRHTHSLREDLATMLRAERAVIEAGKVRRASAPDADTLFTEVEQDAQRRATAIEHYVAAVEEPSLGASAATSALDDYCSSERRLAKMATAKKPAQNASQKRVDCESYAQLRGNVRWEDATSVAAFATAIESLKTLPSPRVGLSVEHAKALSAALRSVAEDRAIFTGQQDAVARVEPRATATFGQCHTAPALPALLVASAPSQRALTVVISARAPKGLREDFERAAVSATAEEAQLYRGVAAGSSGSGFIVALRGEGNARETYVVTNRHVADLASSLSITLESGAVFEATPVFVDPGYDLAVLVAKDPNQKIAPDGGFDLARRAALDGEEVSATGYPGLMGEPSFQLTKGHVSNASLVFPDGKLLHVQHTAAIDPGSSGGPLLGAHLEVLGVNTFKLVGREAVGIAVPADAVARAIVSARAASRCDDACKKRAAEDACLSLVSELARSQPNTTTIQRMLGEQIVTERGIESHNVVVRHDPSIHARFRSSPVATLAEAVSRRIIGDVIDAGGVQPVETCSQIRAAKSTDGNRFDVSITLMDGPRDLSFAWDNSRWRLAEYPFEPDEGSAEQAPPPPPKAAKKKPSAPSAKKPVKAAKP